MISSSLKIATSRILSISIFDDIFSMTWKITVLTSKLIFVDASFVQKIRRSWVEYRFESFAIPFARRCLRLSDETLKAVGAFYLVSMTGEVKYPTEEVNVHPVVDSLDPDKDTF